MIARHLAVACLIYLVLVVQPSVASHLTFESFRPWLPGIAVVVCALVFEGPAGLLWAGVLGAGVDCQSVERPGIHLVIATLTMSGLMTVRPDDKSRSVISLTLLVFGASFVWRMAASIVHAFLDRHPIVTADLALSACWEGFSSSSVVIAVIVAWRLIKNSIWPQQRSIMSLNNQWSMLTEK